MLVYNGLDGGGLNDRVEVGIELCDLNNVCCDGFSRRWRLINGVRKQRLVELFEKVSEVLHVPGSVLIYSEVIGLLVGEDKSLEELILEISRSGEVLACGSNLWFETYQIKFKTLTIDNSLHHVGKVGLATAGEEDGKSIFLLHAQFHELNLVSGQLLQSMLGRGISTIFSFHQPSQALLSSCSNPPPVALKMLGSCHHPPLAKHSIDCR